MRRTPLFGGSLFRGVSRPAVLATFPWLSIRHRHRLEKPWPAASTREDPGAETHPVVLEHVLAQLRKAQGIDLLGPNVEAVVSGRGRHLGIAVSWSLRWTSSGCFAEEIRGPQLTFKWGYDGQRDSGCWEVDSSGLVRVMECDDHEAVLMTTYLRTGCWLQPHLQDRFEMELLPTPAFAPIPPPPPSSSSSAASPATAASSPDVGRAGGGSDAGNVGGSHAHRGSSPSSPSSSSAGQSPSTGGARQGHGRGPAAAVAAAGAAGSSREEVIAIGLRVKGKKLRVRVLVRRRDWRLLGFDHRMCADTETWELGEWREWAEGVHYPSSALHKASNGGQHAYLTSAGAAERVTPLAEALLQPPLPSSTPSPSSSSSSSSRSYSPQPLSFSSSSASASSSSSLLDSAATTAPQPEERLEVTENGAGASVAPVASSQDRAQPLPSPTHFGLPLLSPIPGDATYSLPSGGQAVSLWRAASGHYLVRPAINGQEGGGYFVLDTGASGFVVTPQAAARLGGQSFGETHAASISGKVAARFVSLGSWSLGGLSIRQPVLMVMELEGLVRGAPGEVVGIVGHDLFRRAVVELPQLTGAAQTATGRTSSSAAIGSGSGFGSCSDSGSGSEDESGPAASWDMAASRREAAAAAVAAPAFGPPPPAPRSTPAFDEDDGSSSSSRAPAMAAAAARSQPVSVAAAAVPPAPSTALDEPTASSSPASPSLSWPVPPFSSSQGGGAAATPLASQQGLSGQAAAAGAVAGSSGGGDHRLRSKQPTLPQSNSAGSSGASSFCGSSSSSRSTSSSRSARDGNMMSSTGTSNSHATSRSSSPSDSSSRSPAAVNSRSDSDLSSSSSSSSRRITGVKSGSSSGGGAVRMSAGRSTTARAVRRAARTMPYTLHEMTLHHPLEYGNEPEWVWEPLVMIANLPHVHVRFADPWVSGGPPRSALLMVDSGACGADIMLHARAQKELGLMGSGPGAAGGGGSGASKSQGHYLRGVGQDPKDFVQLQVLDLPWLEMAGVRFEQVRSMCAAVGGLDISIYSHGILCGDLLGRLEWAIDYTHKRMGFRRGAFAPALRAGGR